MQRRDDCGACSDLTLRVRQAARDCHEPFLEKNNLRQPMDFLFAKPYVAYRQLRGILHWAFP